ncbi:hypothetical protein [Oceanobacillus bengalensis]|uniref:Uncharacterized protein n=1 Tax=Oceanobacillus bengalensis TaxID=1435466 RepID=A0A494YTF4_9BACI|nr:hypothetical protein [Oceanobacillus bengalensis]RKQ13355.1 hypothetical protein D8M05_16435 [Oceanobacillus bengalensis]
MKKVIDGAVYNTQTAKKICEQLTNEANHEKGVYVKQLKQLYKTKSGKYFFFIKNEFPAYVDVNDDDLNPKFELTDVEEKKIIPVSYELAVQFASEMITSNPESKKVVGKFFPELIRNEMDENKKIQKKIYISEKANWYLEMMLTESKYTNSSFIENLIVDKYRSLYKKGMMQGDPYFEMEDD